MVHHSQQTKQNVPTPYTLLGVPVTASMEQIKKAYKKLALKFHPDKNKQPGSEKMFKKIAQAYQILTDPELRRKCDAGFNDFDSYNFASNDRTSGLQDPPVYYDFYVTLEEVYFGCTKEVSVTRKCGDYSLYTEETVSFQINVRPGSFPGKRFVFEREGDRLSDRVPANVIFVLREIEHPRFKRDGINLRLSQSISLKEALCGLNMQIEVIDGSVHSVEIDRIVQPRSSKRLPGLGMPCGNDSHGDLIIDFDIVFPDKLSSTTRTFIRSVLKMSKDINDVLGVSSNDFTKVKANFSTLSSVYKQAEKESGKPAERYKEILDAYNEAINNIIKKDLGEECEKKTDEDEKQSSNDSGTEDCEKEEDEKEKRKESEESGERSERSRESNNNCTQQNADDERTEKKSPYERWEEEDAKMQKDDEEKKPKYDRPASSSNISEDSGSFSEEEEVYDYADDSEEVTNGNVYISNGPHAIPVSLEDIYTGAKVPVYVERRILDARCGRMKRQIKKFILDISRGCADGTRIIFIGEGDQHYGRPPADLLFVIWSKPHKEFVRDRSNLIARYRLQLEDALCGCEMTVPLLDGTKENVIFDEVIKPQTVRRLEGKGLYDPIQQKNGDVVIECFIQFPFTISSVAKEKLKVLLPD
ncbi:hypothetical protein AB6A40_000373 [Gnathostoma spinigerum]|uniref:DnaJ homolog dnj-20 n=1 Tax=Gnathostoma spinigerum TaxID=75299 RepID=A0ABD6E1Z4_9BILA